MALHAEARKAVLEIVEAKKALVNAERELTAMQNAVDRLADDYSRCVATQLKTSPGQNARIPESCTVMVGPAEVYVVTRTNDCIDITRLEHFVDATKSVGQRGEPHRV